MAAMKITECFENSQCPDSISDRFKPNSRKQGLESVIFKRAGEAAARAGDHRLGVKSAVSPDPWLCQGTRRERQAGGRAEESRL